MCWNCQIRGPGQLRLVGLAAIAAIALMLGAAFTASPRPVSAQAATPTACTVGVDLLSLHAFNLDENTFDAEFWIWSVCPENTTKPLTTLEFVNANASSVSLQGATTVDGKYWDYARVEGTFRYYWDLTEFPFDDHTLEIQIENSAYDATDFVFVPDTAGSAYEPDLPIEGWRVTNFGVGTAPKSYHTTYGDPSNPVGSSDYSRFTVDITMERANYDSFFKLTFVVYMAFLLSLVSYFVNLQNPALLTARLSVISAALFAVAVNLRTATTALSSEDGVTLVGKIHVAALVAILVDAIAALVTQMLVERGHPEAQVKRFDRIVMVLVVVGFVAVNIWLIVDAALRNQ